MSLKIYAIILLLFGISCIVISNTQKCQSQKIEYKYIPRTFQQEQNNPIYPSDIFIKMFQKPDPWMLGISALDFHKNEAIQKYFVQSVTGKN